MITPTLELPTPAKQSHADRLAAAAARTAAARREVDEHAALAAEVDRLKTRAAAGDLDDREAGDLLKKAEAHRLGEITRPRRQRALDDALAAEVAVALDVLGELAAALAPLKAEAEAAADALTAALVHPAAAAIRGDTSAGHERDTGRCMVEAFMPGVFPAAVLADKIRVAGTTTWGSGHCPQAAAEIVEGFDHELAAIRKGAAALKAATKALEKSFA